MPQELHVLRCYNCEAFQVHIVKKIPKWDCKMCGEKQSVKKVYAKGSGKDCRLYVQQLNQKRLEASRNINQNDSECSVLNSTDNTVSGSLLNTTNKVNGWMEFMPTDDITVETESEVQNAVTVNSKTDNKSECFKYDAYEKFKKHMDTKNNVQDKPKPNKYSIGCKKRNNGSNPQLKLMPAPIIKNSDYSKFEKLPTTKSSFDMETMVKSNFNFKSSQWEEFKTSDLEHKDTPQTDEICLYSFEEPSKKCDATTVNKQLHHKQKFEEGFSYKTDDKQNKRSSQQSFINTATSDNCDIKFSNKKIKKLKFKMEKGSPENTNTNKISSKNISRWTEYMQTDNDESNYTQDLHLEKSIFDIQNLPTNKLQHVQNVYSDVSGQNMITDMLQSTAAAQNKETEICNNTNSKYDQRIAGKETSLFDGEESDIDSIFKF